MRHLLADRLKGGTIAVVAAYVLLLSAFFGSLASTAVSAEGSGFVLCSALADGAAGVPEVPAPKADHQHECCLPGNAFGAGSLAILAADPLRVAPPPAVGRPLIRAHSTAKQTSGPPRLAKPRAPPATSA
jgi:hypothetical protein